MSETTRAKWSRIGRWALVMAAAGFGLSACSSGPKGASGTTTTKAGSPPTTGTTTTTAPHHPVISKSRAASTFSTAVAPANAALGTFSTKIGTWSAATTRVQAEADAAPALEGLTTLEPKLQTLAFYYPAAAKDIEAEINAAGTVQDDIANLGAVNFQDPSSWTTKFTSDVAALNAAAKVVANDLGVAAPS